ncbi:hypothetical protein BU15DRAFT_85859 [Melanogaster broomeanus]|nr:hypothetical protein BU15DRAFT_85859 [Melanogaster broomeanus]
MLGVVLAPLYLLGTCAYVFVQRLLISVWKPAPPPKRIEHPYARIAVIGAGLTGISSAAHAVSHGFEVVIFEADDRVGGIWAHENKTSGLQLNSLLYRFHPAVRDEILSGRSFLWKEYGRNIRLDERTRLNTRVTKVRRVKRKEADKAYVPSLSMWDINDGRDGPFDALIVTVGTCGEPYWVPFEGMPADAGKIDKLDAAGKRHQQELASGSGIPEDSVERGPDDGNRRSQVETSRQGQHETSEGVVAPCGDTTHVKFSESLPVTSRQDADIYRGTVLHSSQLDHATPEVLQDGTVVVIGGGASAVEAVETAFSRGASRCIVLAKEDKVGNVIFDTMIAAQPFGREMPLSFLWERFLRFWHYHGVEDLVPKHPSSVIVNDEFLDYIRSGRCVYVRGDTLRLTQKGVLVNVREWIERGTSGTGSGVTERDNKDIQATPRDTDTSASNISATKQQAKQKQTRPRSVSHMEEISADVIVLATGYKRPSIDFLPRELFPEGYERPNLYLQNFCTEDWSVLMTNSAYQTAIGTVGHFHIGIYTRILLTFLLDPDTRPTSKDMKLWVDVIRYVKRGASGGALGFFTYMELTIWILLFHIFRPDRLWWMPFILAGWGVRPDDERLLRRLEAYARRAQQESDRDQIWK